jgi:squalene cyclase
MAIRALQVYGPPARRAENRERIARAAHMLASAVPSTTEDSVMQVLGLKWADADRKQTEVAARRLAGLQLQDGGWAQTPRHSTDAYATGTALHALFESGISPAAATYRKGVAFLLSTQAADGSWRVTSRAPKFQPYFEGGFPYGHDQWISQWATSWATIALTHSVSIANVQAQ